MSKELQSELDQRLLELYDYKQRVNKLIDENARLNRLINNPEIEVFLEGVRIESAHQTEKHGKQVEETKFPHDYNLVLDYLKGKLTKAIWEKNMEKYKHHLITISAVCYNIHRQVQNPGTSIYKWFQSKINEN